MDREIIFWLYAAQTRGFEIHEFRGSVPAVVPKSLR
jgi:hypothetical protein